MYWEHSDWYRGVEDAKDFEKVLRSSPLLIEQLLKIVQNYKQEAELTKKPDYNSAGWPYAAADANGFGRACNKLIVLLTNKDQE